MDRSGPARGPNPIRREGSTCAPPPSSFPSLLPPTANSGAETPDREGENSATASRGENNPRGVLNQRSKKVGAGASQPAATMRRASKKSSSSAATASAGNAPAPGSLPPPIVLVFPDRVASSRAARMLPCSRDWIRVLFPLEDPISRPRRAGAR